MDVNEIVTLEDLKKFLDEHRLSMTMHIAHGSINVSLTSYRGGAPMTGRGDSIENALVQAWAQY